MSVRGPKPPGPHIKLQKPPSTAPKPPTPPSTAPKTPNKSKVLPPIRYGQSITNSGNKKSGETISGVPIKKATPEFEEGILKNLSSSKHNPKSRAHNPKSGVLRYFNHSKAPKTQKQTQKQNHTKIPKPPNKLAQETVNIIENKATSTTPTPKQRSSIATPELSTQIKNALSVLSIRNSVPVPESNSKNAKAKQQKTNGATNGIRTQMITGLSTNSSNANSNDGATTKPTDQPATTEPKPTDQPATATETAPTALTATQTAATNETTAAPTPKQIEKPTDQPATATETAPTPKQIKKTTDQPALTATQTAASTPIAALTEPEVAIKETIPTPTKLTPTAATQNTGNPKNDNIKFEEFLPRGTILDKTNIDIARAESGLPPAPQTTLETLSTSFEELNKHSSTNTNTKINTLPNSSFKKFSFNKSLNNESSTNNLSNSTQQQVLTRETNGYSAIAATKARKIVGKKKMKKLIYNAEQKQILLRKIKKAEEAAMRGPSFFSKILGGLGFNSGDGRDTAQYIEILKSKINKLDNNIAKGETRLANKRKAAQNNATLKNIKEKQKAINRTKHYRNLLSQYIQGETSGNIDVPHTQKNTHEIEVIRKQRAENKKTKTNIPEIEGNTRANGFGENMESLFNSKNKPLVRTMNQTSNATKSKATANAMIDKNPYTLLGLNSKISVSEDSKLPKLKQVQSTELILNTANTPVITSKQSRTPHDILGISPGATDNEIKKAYRKKTLQLHPNKVKQRLVIQGATADTIQKAINEATEKFNELATAYNKIKSLKIPISTDTPTTYESTSASATKPESNLPKLLALSEPKQTQSTPIGTGKSFSEQIQPTNGSNAKARNAANSLLFG